MKTCQNCGKELEENAAVCQNCGKKVKVKAPIYKKWWFWVAIVAVIFVAANSSADGDDNGNQDIPAGTQGSVIQQPTETITEPPVTYEVVELQTMLDDLEENAMRAEKTYQDKHVEITGKIDSFDSDGAYISIEPDTEIIYWTTVMCYIKNDTQSQFLMNKSVGDTVTIKGEITLIGEVLGYSIDIHEIS